MKKRAILTPVLLGLSLSISTLVVGTANATESSSPKYVNQYGLPDFTRLVEENNQVVVNISTNKMIKHPKLPPQFRGIPEEMLRYFFGIPPSGNDEFFGHPNPHGKQTPEAPAKKQPHSLGSGFIISEDGYILTNHHVVDGADEIIVKMRDRRELQAEVIGSDERTDVALLKIKAKGLPVAKLAKQKKLKVGQWVLAIGEPFGLDYTVTHGIISALGRALPDDTYVPFIQSDVSINPGNSGGPLFNMEGEVIGINSQIYSSSGGAIGLSFSIPIDIAMNVADQLRNKGEVVRGYLGVLIQEVTSDLSKSFGLQRPMGALVGETVPNSPAEKAGLQSGDIILEFDGKAIEKSTDLPPIVGVTPLNKTVKMKVWRQGNAQWLETNLAALQTDGEMAEAPEKPKSGNLLGLELENVEEATLRELKLPFGVAVKNVGDGPAAKAGIRQGDILVTIDFQPVKSVREVSKLLKKLPKGKSIPMRIVRDGRSLFLPLILEKE